MIHLRKLFRQIITLVVLIGLVAITLWLVGNQRQPPTPLAAQTTEPSQSTAVPSATLTNPPPPRPTSTPTNPNVGYTPPSVGVVVTLISPPTPAPSPTSTPTFEPLSDKPIMGFVFKPPKEVPNTQYPDGFDIVDWLSDSSKEVLLKGAKTLETVDISNGMVKRYAQVKSPGDIFQPIWLSKAQGVAYLSSDNQTNKTNLWLGQVDGKMEILLSDVDVPLIPLPKGQGVMIYDKKSKYLKTISPDKQNLKSTPQSATLPFPQKETGKLLNTTYQPSGDWGAYYNYYEFWLVNLATREVRPIDLGGNKFEPSWAMEAKWSPDGRKLALIVTQGPPSIYFSDLCILEWPAGTLRKIDDTFTYVTDIAWAPDSEHILFEAVIGQKDGVNVNALYITDLSTSATILPVPIPIEGLGSNFGGGLSWSHDGRTVLVKYANSQGVALYKIEVAP